jgi:hypothetical protein
LGRDDLLFICLLWSLWSCQASTGSICLACVLLVDSLDLGRLAISLHSCVASSRGGTSTKVREVQLRRSQIPLMIQEAEILKRSTLRLEIMVKRATARIHSDLFHYSKSRDSLFNRKFSLTRSSDARLSVELRLRYLVCNLIVLKGFGNSLNFARKRALPKLKRGMLLSS